MRNVRVQGTEQFGINRVKMNKKESSSEKNI